MSFSAVTAEDYPDNLQFRPTALQSWFLYTTISFNFIVILLLILLQIEPRFDLLNEWAYFVIQILPIIVGTVTTTTFESVIDSLSRITPFIRCASPEGDTANNTILLSYLPILGVAESFRTKN